MEDHVVFEHETRGTLPAATPPYIDRACFMVIWFLSFDVKLLLLVKKLKAISQGGTERNGTV